MTDLPMTKAPDDLVKELLFHAAKRDGEPNVTRIGCSTLREAADKIERLRSQLAAAEAERDDLRFAVSGLNKDWNKAMAQLQAMRKALETFLMCWDFDHGSWSLAALEAAKGRAKAALTEGAGK